MLLTQILEALAELAHHPWIEVTHAEIAKPMLAPDRKALDAALKRGGRVLPDDIRAFYAAANGVHIEYELRRGLREAPEVLAATADLGGPGGVRGGIRLLPLMRQRRGATTPVLLRRLELQGGLPIARMHEPFRFGAETTTLAEFHRRLMPFDVYEDASICFLAHHEGGTFGVMRALEWDWSSSRILGFTDYIEAICRARFLDGTRARLFALADAAPIPTHPLLSRFTTSPTTATTATTAAPTRYARIHSALAELRAHPWIVVERATFGKPLSASAEKQALKARGKGAPPIPDEIVQLWREHNGCAISWRLKPELIDREEVRQAVSEWGEERLDRPFGALEIPAFSDVFVQNNYQRDLILASLAPEVGGVPASPSSFNYHQEATTHHEFARRLRPFDMFAADGESVMAFVERHDRGTWGVIQLQDHCVDWDGSWMTDFETYLRAMCDARFICAARRRFFGHPTSSPCGHLRKILQYADLGLAGWTPALFGQKP